MDEKEIIRFIANQVAAGESIEYAERIALNLASKEVVQEALQSLQQARDEMANLKEPTTIGVSDFPTWYPGPLDHHKHWPGLRDALSEKGLSGEDLDEVDRASSKIVSRLGPPNAAEIATRGLVLGHVQSGKTTNFSAVMAKAADAGYRLFIVLSGLHNALREQTQSRLEQDLVTAEERWFKLTHDGDFHSPGNAAAMLSTRDKRCLAVVKKNSHRLRRLIRWLDSAPDAVRACPILVVDDEADQASINVGAAEDPGFEASKLQAPKFYRHEFTANDLLDQMLRGQGRIALAWPHAVVDDGDLLVENLRVNSCKLVADWVQVLQLSRQASCRMDLTKGRDHAAGFSVLGSNSLDRRRSSGHGSVLPIFRKDLAPDFWSDLAPCLPNDVDGVPSDQAAIAET